MKDFSKGQTLVEVLFAIAVASSVLIGLTRATTVALRNARFAKNQALATEYAQETMEKMRAKRDQTDWSSFKGDCVPSSLPSLSGFTRDIRCDCYVDDAPRDCSDADINKVKTTVTVSWNSHQAELVSFLTKWQ